MNTKLSDSFIIVTGYTGFLGSKLIKALEKTNATIVGLNLRPDKAGQESELFRNGQNMRITHIDYKTEQLLTKNEWDMNTSACFHFAGNASATDCQENPPSAYESNVQLTYRVLEYCRKVGIQKFIYPSTGYVYGNHLKEPANEKNQLISTNIYTATKIAAEALIESYAHYHDFQCKIGRISNVYGKESSEETVSGTIIKNALKKNTIVLNTLKPVRDFVFIDDVVDGFLAMLENGGPHSCSYFNISTGKATSIQELAEVACKLVSVPKSYIESRHIDQYSDTRLVLNCDKMKERFNWTPRYSLKEGLTKILSRK